MSKNENFFTDNFNIINLFPEVKANEIMSKSGTGIKNGADRLLRFYIKDNNFIPTNESQNNQIFKPLVPVF